MRAELEAEVIKLEKSLHLDTHDLEASNDLKKELQVKLKEVDASLAVVQKDVMTLNKDLADLKSRKQTLRLEVNQLRDPRLLAQLSAFEDSRQKCREDTLRMESDLKNVLNRMEQMLAPEKEKISEILKQHEKEEVTFKDEIAKLTEAITIQQGETLIASDEGKLTVSFNPAATITLFPETQVEIIQTLPLNLVFNQTKGIGQYQVSGASPVTIRGFNLIVNIDEGLLNIDTDEETGVITLSLKTGAAKVGYNSPEFDSKVWSLEPGDIFEYDSNERRGYFNALW